MQTRIARWSLATCVAIAVLVAAPRASHACSRYASFPTLLEPVFEAPDHVIESTELTLACTPLGIDASCTLEARYRVHNRGSAAARSRAMIVVSRLVPTATLDANGRATPVVLERTTADPTLVRSVDCEDRHFFGRGTAAFAFEVPLAAGEARELVVRSTFVLRKMFALVGGHGDCNVDEGVQHRHPFVSAGRSAGQFGVRYVMSTNRSIDPASKLALHVRHPRAWRAELYRTGDTLPAASTHDDGDDLREDVDVAFDADHQVIEIGMYVERGPIFNGGPFVGANWAFAPDGGVRVRAGYEIASPPWLLESIALESDLGRRLTMVPAVEAVTNTILVFGAGLGVPIRLRPDTQLGGRVQLSASVGVFTLRGAFDFYPGTALLPHLYEGSLGPQISF